MFTETESNATETLTEQHEPHIEPAAEKLRRKRTYKPRRARTEQPKPEPNQVKVSANFSLPIEQFAQLANDQSEDYDDEEIEETEEIDSPVDRNLLFGTGLASVPFRSPVADEGRAEYVRDHLRQVSEANAFKAKIWRVPEGFAIRNPLIQRKPASAPGWAYQGDIPYDPDSLDSDLLTLFSDGFYFVEIRERGLFRSGMLKTIGNPAAKSSDAVAPIVPPQPVYIHEPAPVVDPVKEATAQAKILDTVLTATTRLLEAQTAQQPAQQKQPSLKERLEEMKLMQQMFAPPAPTQQQRDPLEKLAEALESETLKKILGTIKSDNPVEPQPEGSSFWDFASGAVEQLAPGLNPLLAGLGRWLMTTAFSGDGGQQPKPVNQSAAIPVGTSLPTQQTNATPPEATPEDDGVDIRFLIQDLANQVPPEDTAQKVKDLMANKPFIRPFLKKYLAADNQTILNEVVGLAENETEAASLRQALEACEWRDEWLNSLKQHLQS